MNLMQRLISAGFAIAALASAAVPTLALSSWQDLELAWDAPVTTMEAMSAGQPEASRDDAAATGFPRR